MLMALVLVVDDDPDIRELIRINLEAAGYEVVTAGNGSEALAAVEREPPDAIFLDLMMPEVDGWVVLEELKSKISTDLSAIPVFMVTGRSEPETRLRSGIEGALEFIQKPFDPDNLTDALERVLGPDAVPEEVQRKQVRAASMEALARFERTGDDDGEEVAEPRVHLTRLEHTPSTAVPSPRLGQARQRLKQLTPKQLELIDALATGKPVTRVADDLGMSRSNVYASLRRIGRRLGLEGTKELLALLRQGVLTER
jgi:CheY-like chemotaxis protein/DNA-binding CsgD family transcriptional regulator